MLHAYFIFRSLAHFASLATANPAPSPECWQPSNQKVKLPKRCYSLQVYKLWYS